MASRSQTSIINQVSGRKSNKAFMILSALGILFVADVHLGQPLSILTKIFPYDSFFMPMFTFISGYFFKESHCRSWKDVVNYSFSKFNRLFLPYLGWAVFYNCLCSILFRMGIWNISGLSLRDLIYNIATSGVTSAFCSPAWFAPLLFSVCVVYCAVRRILSSVWNDHLALAALLAVSVAAVKASGTDFRIPLLYMPLKIGFFLSFYHAGLYFRKYLEDRFDRLHPIAVCLSAAVINWALISRYGNTIAFPVCSSMSGFQSGNLLLPLITSATGTVFWLKIAKLLAPMIGHNRLVNYISENTFFIMTHHIGVKHLFIGCCLLGHQLGISAFSGIDKQQFLTDGLYLYTVHPWCAPVCIFFTMVVLIFSCKIWQNITKILSNMILKKQP